MAAQSSEQQGRGKSGLAQRGVGVASGQHAFDFELDQVRKERHPCIAESWNYPYASRFFRAFLPRAAIARIDFSPYRGGAPSSVAVRLRHLTFVLSVRLEALLVAVR